MNYENDLKIDESALDVECLEQPELMLKYSQLLADAKYERDKAKERLDVVRAEVDLDIRQTPNDYGLEKVTEAAIQNTVVKQKKYKDAVDEYLEARHEADMLSGAVSSFEQRKSMIEALVKLHGQQYYAGPSVPRDIVSERQKKQKKVDEGVGKRLKRNKK